MSDTIARINGIITDLNIVGANDGPLTKKHFVAKDMFDVEGYVTGAGNPDWQRTHCAATSTAPAIAMLLEAGATLVGKACTDELAYSIDGINIHYGAPINPQFPDRVSGGSSSGSASAVASELVDLAIGTDTGGSVRVPASYCGIYGFRPTHGRIAVDGVIPLAPSLDTVGWFARSPSVLQSCGSVLLQERFSNAAPTKVLVARECFDLVHDKIKAVMNKYIGMLVNCFSELRMTNLDDLGWHRFPQHFGILQAFEVWRCHGQWFSETKPVMDQAISDRFKFAQTVAQAQYMGSMEFRKKVIDGFDKLLFDGAVLCFPTTWNLAPLITSSATELLRNREKNMMLTSIAGLAGLPQVTVPVKMSQTTATGLSFLAGPGKDMLLLNLCQELTRAGICSAPSSLHSI